MIERRYELWVSKKNLECFKKWVDIVDMELLAKVCVWQLKKKNKK